MPTTQETPKEYISIADFRGGLNVFDNPMVIADNELQDCYNFILLSNGALKKRFGYDKVSSSTTMPSEIRGIYQILRYYTPTTSKTIVACHTTGNAALYEYNNSASWTKLSGGTAFSPGVRIRMLVYRGVLLAFNGEQFKYWNNGGSLGDVVFKSGSVAVYPEFMEICDDRLFAVGPVIPPGGTLTDDDNSVFFTDYGAWGAGQTPSTASAGMNFPLNWDFLVPERSESKKGITGLKSFSNLDELCVLRENDFWALMGTSEDDYELRKMGTAGLVNQEAIVDVNGILYFWGSQNAYAFDGQQCVPIGRNIKSLFVGVDLSNAVVFYHPISDIIVFSYADGCFFYNVSGNNWTQGDLDVQAATTFWHSSDFQLTVISRYSDINVYKLETTIDNDNGATIQFHMRTKYYQFGGFENTKIFRSIKAVYKSDHSATELPFDFYVNIDDGLHVITLSELVAGDRWNQANWNYGVWAGTGLIFGSSALPEDMVGHVMYFKISGINNHNLEIYGVATEVKQLNIRREEAR